MAIGQKALAQAEKPFFRQTLKKQQKSLEVQNKAVPLHPVSETLLIAVIAQLVEQRIRNA